MKILTAWLRAILPTISVSDRQLADDLTLRGIAVEGVHDLGVSPSGEMNGHLFEMDITTNRVDAMNHRGIAREIATMYALELPALEPVLPAVREAGAASAARPFSVRIDPEAEALCGRFTARVLRGVTVRPSSGEVKTFFELLGQKQISNAVDASNFTLLGMGHPTHAFDLDRIEGGIVVRLARRGEVLKLLDGTTRTLEADDLVVADEQKALGLAGVMGGWESMITPGTKNVLVEAAWFDPAAVRRSSRRHGLHTDASHRFERGADFNAAPLANDLVAELILRDGGTIDGTMVDLAVPAIEQRTAKRAAISLSVREVQRHLGTTVEDGKSEGRRGEDRTSENKKNESRQGEDRDVAGESALRSAVVEQYLTSLGCRMTAEGDGSYSVALPSWRLDLEREIDLIEEVARVFGYNRFANTLPMPLPVLRHPVEAQERAVRTRLLALGFTEAISSTFASAAEAALFAPEETSGSTGEGVALRHVAMENPLSAEATLLRPTMLPGMLAMLANNLNRDVREARLFEQGQVFLGTADDEGVGEVMETASLVLGVTSETTERTSLYSAEDAPIFELKGVIESLASLFTLAGGAESLRFSSEKVPAWMEAGRGGIALLHNRPLAVFGELSRTEQAARKLRQPVYLATIAISELLTLPLQVHTAREISRFQAVERDLSFLFPDTTKWHTIAATIEALALPELERLLPLEIFRDPKGKAIAVGQHSLLFRLVFHSATRTLTDSDLVEASRRVTEALTAMGGVQRMPGS